MAGRREQQARRDRRLRVTGTAALARRLEWILGHLVRASAIDHGSATCERPRSITALSRELEVDASRFALVHARWTSASICQPSSAVVDVVRSYVSRSARTAAWSFRSQARGRRIEIRPRPCTMDLGLDLPTPLCGGRRIVNVLLEERANCVLVV